ncbi:MAG: clostripain-related cysteine peptidase [Lentisphaerota bacterium]
MKKFFKRIVLSAIMLLCVFSLNNSFAESKTTAEYTMILYLNGCDLESNINSQTNQLNGEASDALEVLQNSSFDDSKLNIIVVTGGTKKWRLQEPKISTTQCQAWRVWGEPQKKMELVKETDPGMSMTDKATLSEYISWAIKNYPAKKYALFMWNHGAGPIGGFGTDELNDNKSISISDIRSGLKSAIGGNKFELIAFTCCLMGNFETAYQLKELSNYMVGSEDLSYGDAFDETVKGFAAKPDISGKDLGKVFINAHFKGAYDGRLYTFSLIDLSKVSDIKYNWDNMIKQLDEKMNVKSSSGANMYRALAVARAYTESYNEFSREADGIGDMYNFAECISDVCAINTEALKKSIKDAVLYNKACKLRPNSNGLSIYFVDRKFEQALGHDNDLIKYRPGTPSKLYFDFLTNYYNKLFVQDASKIIGSISFTSRSLIDLNPNAHPSEYGVSIDLDDVPLVNQIWFVIGKLEGDDADKNFKTLCIDKEIGFDPETGNIGAEVSGKQYCLGGKPIAIYWDGDVNRWKNPKYIPMGSFAVKHKGDVKFIVLQEKSKDSAEIIGAWNSKEFNGNVIPATGSLDSENIPKIGDKITILYKACGKYADGPEVVLNSYNITKSNIESGEYCGAFYIEDVIGRKIWSYRKSFTLSSSAGIKASKNKNVDEEMTDNQSL